MDLHISVLRRRTPSLTLIKHPAQVPSASITGFVRVVNWRRNADAGRGLAVKIAHVVGQKLQLTHGFRSHRGSKDFVQQNKVVCWSCCAGDCGMRLQEEVPVTILGDGVIDYLFGSQ